MPEITWEYALVDAVLPSEQCRQQLGCGEGVHNDVLLLSPLVVDGALEWQKLPPAAVCVNKCVLWSAVSVVCSLPVVV